MEDKLLEEAFILADPKHKTKFEKSRTAFLSFNVSLGQIHFSAYLARYMAIMSGDRIGFIKHKNPLIWFVFKTTQDFRTAEVKVRNGTWTINSREWCKEIATAFKMNMNYKGKIRLYVNNLNPIAHKVAHPDGTKEENLMMQLFDVPNFRKDFETPEQFEEYKAWHSNQSYIININKDANS